jgi:hypothetical protein
MKRFLQEKTVSDLRADLTKFGYSEKEGELSSGGGLKSDFVDILSYLLTEWHTKNSNNCKLTFTAGNDVFHKNRKSRHTNGEAVDVVVPQECRADFIQILERYKPIYPGFSYIDEYTHPSKGSTGGHFHLSYRQGQPEGGVDNKEEGTDDMQTSTTDLTTTKPVTTNTTTSATSGDDYNVYGGLTTAITGGLGAKGFKKAGEDIWNKTMGKIQKAMTESVNSESNRLNEEINRIKEMMK